MSRLVASFVAFLITTTVVWGAQPDGRVRITSKTLVVRNQDNKAIFQGEVVLTRAGLTVHSDEMIVFYNRSGSQDQGEDRANGKVTDTGSVDKGKRGGELPSMSNRSISMIEATGSVVIEREEGKATCRKAVYYENEGKLVLTGDPIAWQKGTKVRGERMTMYLNDDRSVVEGGTQVDIEEVGQVAH